MAELDVGKQCSVLTCKQLDFLPFTCSDCSEVFCLEHRSTTSHKCIAKSQIVKPDEDCDKNISVKIKCFLDGCEIRELLPVKCDFCEEHYCLRHRHQQDHLCPKKENDNSTIKEGKEKVLVQRKAKTGHGGVKCSSRAAKVALMKMKMHASGDNSTPQDERIFFSIVLPSGSPVKTKPMFFSKNWTIGRIIDEIAKHCKLKNENNQRTSKKLRLFDGNTKTQLKIGDTLGTEMCENPETIFNGCELILEYVLES